MRNQSLIYTFIIGLIIHIYSTSGEPCADLELYQCRLSGYCINDFMVCNNIDECDDGSDERKDLCGVVERTKMTGLCPVDGHYFGCVGSPCLALYKVCDGTNDCLYGTDENPRVCGKERFVKAVNLHNSGSGGSGQAPSIIRHTSTIKGYSTTAHVTIMTSRRLSTATISNTNSGSPSVTPVSSKTPTSETYGTEIGLGIRLGLGIGLGLGLPILFVALLVLFGIVLKVIKMKNENENRLKPI